MLYKKFDKILVLIILSVIINSKSLFAAVNNENVRVGLEYKYKNVQSIAISNKNITFGYEINGSYNSEAVLNSSSGFLMQTTNDYYINIGDTYNSYEQAALKAKDFYSAGVTAVPAALNNSLWAVYCGGYESFDKASSAAKQINSNAQVVSPNNRMTKLTMGSNGAIICDNQSAYPSIAASQGDTITFSDRSYRGRIEFNRASGQITAVNVLNIEDYLYGTVPSEIPSKWPIESIKAQAVASRTYTAMTHKHINQGYDLCDSVHCQAYIGYNNETTTTNSAVNLTKGQKIYYNNELIDATYFSSSGGYTDNSENVWPNVVPYLRGVKDTYETESKLWTKTITLNELNNLLTQKGINIGNAIDMKISSTSNGGRVSSLTITGTNGSKTLQNEEVRTFFNPSLDSRMFEIIAGGKIISDEITVQSDSSKITQSLSDISIRGYDGILKQVGLNNSMYVIGSAGQTSVYSMETQTSQASSNTYMISGKGFGHGIGMSQYGAKGMAEAGISYIDILKHYYTGVTIN